MELGPGGAGQDNCDWIIIGKFSIRHGVLDVTGGHWRSAEERGGERRESGSGASEVINSEPSCHLPLISCHRVSHV